MEQKLKEKKMKEIELNKDRVEKNLSQIETLAEVNVNNLERTTLVMKEFHNILNLIHDVIPQGNDLSAAQVRLEVACLCVKTGISNYIESIDNKINELHEDNDNLMKQIDVDTKEISDTENEEDKTQEEILLINDAKDKPIPSIFSDEKK